jgi:hypothetical protein
MGFGGERRAENQHLPPGIAVSRRGWELGMTGLTGISRCDMKTGGTSSYAFHNFIWIFDETLKWLLKEKTRVMGSGRARRLWLRYCTGSRT